LNLVTTRKSLVTILLLQQYHRVKCSSCRHWTR